MIYYNQSIILKLHAHTTVISSVISTDTMQTLLAKNTGLATKKKLLQQQINKLFNNKRVLTLIDKICHMMYLHKL